MFLWVLFFQTFLRFNFFVVVIVVSVTLLCNLLGYLETTFILYNIFVLCYFITNILFYKNDIFFYVEVLKKYIRFVATRANI